MISAFRTLALVVLVSFFLHLGWESLHVPLYAGYERWTGGSSVVLLATIGDVLYTLGAFALLSVFKKNLDWIRDATLSDYLALAATGFFIALFVEYKGLALGRWEYLPAMPIIPFLGVGLSPILEMTFLLPLTLLLVSLAIRKNNGI